MLALKTMGNHPVAIEPDFIESVTADPDNEERCLIRTASGKEHLVQRSYAYVTGVIRKHYENN